LDGEPRPSKALLGVSRNCEGVSGALSKGADETIFLEADKSPMADEEIDRSRRARLTERLMGEPASAQPMLSKTFSSSTGRSWKMSKSGIWLALGGVKAEEVIIKAEGRTPRQAVIIGKVGYSSQGRLQQVADLGAVDA
jgi:hypothetical protein